MSVGSSRVGSGGRPSLRPHRLCIDVHRHRVVPFLAPLCLPRPNTSACASCVRVSSPLILPERFGCLLFVTPGCSCLTCLDTCLMTAMAGPWTPPSPLPVFLPSCPSFALRLAQPIPALTACFLPTLRSCCSVPACRAHQVEIVPPACPFADRLPLGSTPRCLLWSCALTVQQRESEALSVLHGPSS